MPPQAGQGEALPEVITGKPFIFKGEEGNPLLAPRGVCLHGSSLLVSDTGQNRVFVWHTLPEQEYQAPDLVLGQINSHETGRNSGSEVTASTLQYPSGIWTDGKRLAVADAWNHRVLLWHTFPTRPGQPADTVIGQAGFAHNSPNGRIGASPTASTLNWPYGLTSDGERLFIADTGNRRVLVYDRWPEHNGAAADSVIGKPDFFERDYEPNDAIWPYSVKIGPNGELAIADTQYYRVLLWSHWQKALSEPAHRLIGQPDLEANGMNQYGLYPQAHTLSWCYDACFDRHRLLVADTGNSRILAFDSLPETNSPPAKHVIGKPDFTTGSENAETVMGTTASLYWPFSVSAQHNRLAVADTGNHRILLFTLLP